MYGRRYGVGLLMAVVASSAGTGAVGQTPPAAWTQAVAPFEIAQDLWYVGTQELASFLFTSPDGHILLDVPLEQNVDLVEANIRSLGFDPGDVRIVIASQAHFDHVGGIATFVERHGSEVWLSAADSEITARGGVGPGAPRPSYRAFAADRIIGHMERVRVGDLELTARLTPGHTPGCTTWQGRAVVDGEALNWLSICSLGVLPSYILVGDDETYPGIARDFCASIAQLRTVDIDLFLGAHASFFALEARRPALDSGDTRALVDPDRMRRYLDGNAARLDSVLVAQGRPRGCAGLGG